MNDIHSYSYARFAGNTIKVKKTEERAIIPTRSNSDDAGWDLYSITTRSIAPSQRVTIRTGISLQIPEEYVGLIWPRSGMSVKNGIDVLAGVVDSGYRGEIMAPCDNIKDFRFNIKKGDRLFQLVAADNSPISYKLVDSLSDTTRGSGGFGSTGK